MSHDLLVQMAYPVSFSFVQKHFIDEFSKFALELPIINLQQKEFNWIRYLSFYIWIQILH